ncbi:MAG: hypothetical protein ACR2J1_01960 [Methyloceanibacter sp.]|uniref:hypothetical protein n=1 Tax=Methyloceanibacter sp. TaxID=1965321 RepID=UPI003D9BAFDB
MEKYFGSALLGIAGALVISTGASAAVVCNEDGDCWKVKDRHTYPPQVNLQVYDDDWKWADNDRAKYRWRDSGTGRGYYGRGGVWIGF